MSKVTEKYLKNQELLKGWLDSHPEQKEFVSVLQAAGKAFIERKTAEKSGIKVEQMQKTEVSLSVGQVVSEKKFISYLESCVENPRILFSSFNGTPQCTISGVGYVVVAFILADVENIQITTKKDDTSAFDKYIIKYHMKNLDLDYQMSVTIWKK